MTRKKNFNKIFFYNILKILNCKNKLMSPNFSWNNETWKGFYDDKHHKIKISINYVSSFVCDNYGINIYGINIGTSCANPNVISCKLRFTETDFGNKRMFNYHKKFCFSLLFYHSPNVEKLKKITTFLNQMF